MNAIRMITRCAERQQGQAAYVGTSSVESVTSDAPILQPDRDESLFAHVPLPVVSDYGEAA